MAASNSVLGDIKFRKDFKYSRKVPTYVSNSVSCVDEIARWVLDLQGILYKDEPHAPGLYVPVVNKLSGGTGIWNNPVLVTTDALVYTVPSIVQLIEERSAPENKIIPDDPDERKEVLELYEKIYSNLTGPLSKLVYTYLLPHRKYAVPLFTRRVPWKERVIFKLGYPILRNALSKGLGLADGTVEERLKAVDEVFDFVDDLLQDGRKYLAGNRLSLADITFASVAGPLILPDQYGAVITDINEIPDELRQIVYRLRATKAGQFVLRLYQEDKPILRDQSEIPKEPSALSRMNQKIGRVIFGKKFKPNMFFFLQKRFPVVRLPFTKLVLVNKHESVVNVLDRDLDFTIEEINSKKMSKLNDAFFLGMDRNNPQFGRERDMARSIIKREDISSIQGFVKEKAEIMTQSASMYGKLDVVNTLVREVQTQLIRHYFGVHASNDVKMKAWLRAIFWDLFLNLGDDEAIHQKALVAANEMKVCIEHLIDKRKCELKENGRLSDNLLNRMIQLQGQKGFEWLDDDTIRRNISGIITGALETTNKSVVLVLDELFNRPDTLQQAVAIAAKGDIKEMYGYVSEALRFNPHQPLVMRFSEEKQTVHVSNKSYTIPAKSKIFALTAAAMFDQEQFPEPKKFDPNRSASYMNYGFALHECYGKYVNAVTIPTFVAAVLTLPNVRRASGIAGAGTGLMEGPFPNNFVVDFG
ncbi:MAG: cytochrome P450 [Cytophagales bacterium]|nr:cytochrome P450 [Cytophagales bacterium]